MVFYLTVNAHKRHGKMSSVLLFSAVPGGKKLHPRKALRQEDCQGPSGLPVETMVQEGISCV